ncbi:hypothetical protein ACHAP5_006597 [Fusarium lateritium]
MSDPGVHINLSEPSDGDIWYEAEQKNPDVEFDEEDGWHDLNNFSFGPITNIARVNTDTFEFEVVPEYLGIRPGLLKGNLKDGLAIKINYAQARGEQRWYLKNGNEIWTHLDVKVMFDGSFDKDVKLYTM